MDLKNLKIVGVKSENECEIFKKIPKHSGVNLQFTDVTYTVPISKTILNGVSGEFHAGELSAIMGPSGSGKSTLLNILAGYRIVKTSGYVKINDEPQNMQEFRKISRYILQEDCISPQFTIMETMMYASKFKLDSNISAGERQRLINEYLDIFLLRTKSDTLVANISGGERKRLCVALELLNNPAILFVDEPTTGLDEFSATQCVTLLKRLALSGHTIICSIHCPSARLFQMFNKVYVLSAGQCIYQGAVNGIVPYLQQFKLNCPITHNPADYVIEVATHVHGNFQAEMVLTIKNGKNNQWVCGSEPCATELLKYDNDILTPNTDDSWSWESHEGHPTWWSEYCWIFCRIMQQMWRDKTNMKLMIGSNILLSSLMGLTFHKIGNDGAMGVYNYNFVVLTCVQFVFLAMSPMLSYVPQEMQYLRREHFNQWYRLSSYFMALVTSQIPVLCASSVLCSAIMYFLSEQPMQLFRFLLFTGITVLTSVTASSYGLLIGSRLRLLNALFVGPNVIAVWIMLANYAVERSHLSLIENILIYTSFMRHSVEGLMATLFQFKRSDLYCPPTEIICLSAKPQFIMKLTGNLNVCYLNSLSFLFGFYLLFTTLAWLVFKCRFSRWEFLEKNILYRRVRYLQMKYFFAKGVA